MKNQKLGVGELKQARYKRGRAPIPRLHEFETTVNLNGQVQLSRLAEALNRLSAIEDQLQQLDEPLQGVLSALGEPGAKHLVVSMSGLSEFKAVIELVGDLKPAYWKHRDECFDNEELDELLPRLKGDLDELGRLHCLVEPKFKLDNLPDDQEIRQLDSVLKSGGF